MRLYTVPRPRGTIPVGAVLMALLFALPMGAFLVQSETIDLGTCSMKAFVGIPCLSCGSTRATMTLLAGDLIKALKLQPLMISIYFSITIWGLMSFYTFLKNRKLVLDLTKREDLIFKISLVTLPLLNWAYLIATGV